MCWNAGESLTLALCPRKTSWRCGVVRVMISSPGWISRLVGTNCLKNSAASWEKKRGQLCRKSSSPSQLPAGHGCDIIWTPGSRTMAFRFRTVISSIFLTDRFLHFFPKPCGHISGSYSSLFNRGGLWGRRQIWRPLPFNSTIVVIPMSCAFRLRRLAGNGLRSAEKRGFVLLQCRARIFGALSMFLWQARPCGSL